MIEKQILSQKIKENDIKEFVLSFLGKLSCSYVELQRTPLGERVIVHTARPGLVVGRKGENIRILTEKLKEKFQMQNPQVEVAEIENPNLDAATVAKSMVATFEKYGPKRFKAISYKHLENVMKSGARGAEIVVSGRGVPGERSKRWRFLFGYLKKSGDISERFVDRACEMANLMSGAVGIKVSILHPEIRLPDDIIFKEVKVEEVKRVDVKIQVIEEKKVEVIEKKQEEVKKEEKAEKKPEQKDVINKEKRAKTDS